MSMKSASAKNTKTEGASRASGKTTKTKRLTPAARNAVSAVKPIKASKVKSTKALAKSTKTATKASSTKSAAKLDTSVAKVIEVMANSTVSFSDALKKAVSRTHKNLRNVRSVWVKDQSVEVVEGKITVYHVVAKVVFILD